MAITVPIAGQEASAELFGIPVANEVNRMSPLVVAPTAWTNATLQNNWVNLGGSYSPAGYRKIGDIVYLRGTVKTGTLGVPMFTLPVGYRSPYIMLTGTGATDAFATIIVGNDGTVMVTTGNVSMWVSLDFIYWSTV